MGVQLRSCVAARERNASEALAHGAERVADGLGVGGLRSWGTWIGPTIFPPRACALKVKIDYYCISTRGRAGFEVADGDADLSHTVDAGAFGACQEPKSLTGAVLDAAQHRGSVTAFFGTWWPNKSGAPRENWRDTSLSARL